MPKWELPSRLDTVDFGVPRLLKPVGNESTADAFMLRIHTPVPGSRSNPEGEGHFVAFGNACTHMGCLLAGQDWHFVSYKEPTDSSPEEVVCGPCPCHGTSFDLTREGLVILGPATQNLPQLELDIQGRVATGWRNNAIDPRDENWPGPADTGE